MSYFQTQQVTKHIRRLILPCGVCVYLVQGSQRAALLDTGFGIGDLRAEVERQTKTPYQVLVSHGHLDHAGGASQFGRVFLSQADFALEKRHNTWQRRYDEILTGPGGPPEGFTPQQLCPDRIEPYAPLADGDVFELGGVQVEAIAVPGHTAGMMVFLIPEDRAAIFGDACGEMTLLSRQVLPEYAAALRRLQKQQDRFDLILRNHGTFCSDHRILNDNLELTEEILAGRDAAVPLEMMGVSGFAGRPRQHPGKFGNIFYADAKNATW